MAHDTKSVLNQILIILRDHKPHTAAYIAKQLDLIYEDACAVLNKSAKDGVINKNQVNFGKSSVELFSLPPPLMKGSAPTTTTSWQIRYKRIL